MSSDRTCETSNLVHFVHRRLPSISFEWRTWLTMQGQDVTLYWPFRHPRDPYSFSTDTKSDLLMQLFSSWQDFNWQVVARSLCDRWASRVYCETGCQYHHHWDYVEWHVKHCLLTSAMSSAFSGLSWWLRRYFCSCRCELCCWWWVVNELQVLQKVSWTTDMVQCK